VTLKPSASQVIVLESHSFFFSMFVHNYTIVWPKVYTGIYYKSAAVIKFIIAWTFAQPVLNIWFVKLGL
jgi:hypothetical protein